MKYFLYILSALVILASCNKESEILPPSVTFNEPLENAFFNVPEEIFVSAHIESEGILESVSVRLVDANYTPRSQQEVHNPNSSVFELADYITVDDIYLESGAYFIEIIAISAGETKRKYRAIQLSEFPKEFEGVIISHNSGLVSKIDGGSGAFEISEVSTSISNNSTELILSNNFNGQFIVSYSNGTILGIDKNNEEILWEYFENDPTAQTFYNDAQISESDRNNFFSTNHGDIIGLDSSGNLVREISVGENVVADEFIIDGDVMVCEVVHGPLDHRLKVFSMANGSLISQENIQMDVSNILKIENGQYLIAGYGLNSENIQIQIFHSDINAMFSPTSFDIGGIADVEMTSNGFVALAHSSGIYTYDPITDQISYLSEYLDINDLEYDQENEVLILSSDNEVFFYSLFADAEINSFYFGDAVVKMDVIYNK